MNNRKDAERLKKRGPFNVNNATRHSTALRALPAEVFAFWKAVRRAGIWRFQNTDEVE